LEISLNAFWSLATSTVLANCDKIRQTPKLSELVDLKGPYEHFGSIPSRDTLGYKVAIQTILASRRPRKYSNDHTQYESIRKCRTIYSNHSKAFPQANLNPLILGG
jgi:hypothetical protein